MSYDGYDGYDDDDDATLHEHPGNGDLRRGRNDPQEGGQYIGDAETLLRRAVDIVATAPNMPLSSTPRIDRDEIIERQDFVAKTRREADELLDAARVQAERMVQRTEVVRAAEQRARAIIDAAETDSRRLRHETEDFLDQRLGSFEILLDKLQKTVSAGRHRLSIGAQQAEPEDAEEDPTKGFFDQDR